MTSSAPASGAFRWISVAFLAALLTTGMLVVDDYGISWDEIPTREFGIMNVERLVPDLRTLDSLRAARGPGFERFGPVFEILLVQAEKAFTAGDIRATMLMRHRVTFLVYFIGVVLFHRLCRRRFSSGIALLATVCLVASPPLFSHAFYNTKDISFLTGFVAVMLTLDLVLANPTASTRLLHVLGSLLLMGTRVLGLFAMMITAVAALARRPTRRTLLELAGYGVTVAVLLPVVWPVLRIDPIGIIKGAVIGSASNPYTRTNLFRGRQIPASDLPWDYIPTWIAITTPVIVSALFLVGAVALARSMARQPGEFARGERQRDLIVLGWFFVPVLGTVILQPIMYDAWRHLFFVYPALVYIAAVGMETVADAATAAVGEARRRLVQWAATASLLLCLAPAVTFMVVNHPYQHLYFNRLAGRDMAQIKQRFETDYWGLSYREALEYIVRSDPSPAIRLRVATYPGIVNAAMLDPRDQLRLKYVQHDADADYFVGTYRFHPQDYPFPNEVFRVRVGNAAIASVFRLTPRDSLAPPASTSR